MNPSNLDSLCQQKDYGLGLAVIVPSEQAPQSPQRRLQSMTVHLCDNFLHHKWPNELSAAKSEA